MSPPANNQDENQSSNYLLMNGPTSASSNEASKPPGNNHFDFDFSPKLRKIKEENDTVESFPMLTIKPNSNQTLPAITNDEMNPTSYLNPYYQFQPAIKCSDLDDPRQLQHNQTYVNVPLQNGN